MNGHQMNAQNRRLDVRRALRKSALPIVFDRRTWTLATNPSKAAIQIFVLSIMFLAPSIGIISVKLLPALIGIAAVAAITSMILDINVGSRLKNLVFQPQWLVLIPLVAYLALQNARFEGQILSASLVRTVLLIISFAIAMAFTSCYRQEIRTSPINAIFCGGVLLAITLLMMSAAYHAILAWLAPPDIAAYAARNIREINRHIEVTCVTVFLLPVALSRSDRTLAYLVWAILYATLFLTSGYFVATNSIAKVACDTAQIGMPIAATVYLLSRLCPQVAAPIVFGCIASVFIFAPWIYITLYRIPPSAYPFRKELILDRAEIWAGTAYRVLDASWFEFMFGRGRDFLRVDGDFQVPGNFTSVMPFHPHNMALQVWLELGALGVLYLLLFLWTFYSFVRRVPKDHQPFILSCLVMLSVVAVVSHSIWHEWIVAAFFASILQIFILSNPKNSITSNG
jgi:hypothetical protein